MSKLPVRLALIISNYYPGYQNMLDAANDEVAKLGAVVTITSCVPGCFDMPLPVKKLLQRDDVDAVVALGVILPVPYKTKDHDSSTTEITVWDETIANGTIDRLDMLSVEYDKPVIKELIGPGFPVDMVQDRVKLYARAGVQAAVSLVKEMERIGKN
jgi:6,7-dimethyl-8-ribityllumazine synthase